MNRYYTLPAVVAAVLVTVAFAQNQPQQPRGHDSERGALTRPDKQIDQAFVREAFSVNQFEIQLGEWVAQRAQDPQIKQFAQKIVEEHRQANQQLRPIAQQLNVTVSDELLPVHQAKLQAYQQKQGALIDLSFIFDQVSMHHRGVLWYHHISQHAENQQLRQYAQQTLPKLRQHLQQAERIAPGGMEVRLAGERIEGMDREPQQTDREQQNR